LEKGGIMIITINNRYKKREKSKKKISR